jgi:hypothetical protein
MKLTILNRSNEVPADGWYQIEVTGEHPAGENRVQVIDETALDAIVARFQKEKDEAGENFAGILVDRDHLSHDLENETAAMAWLKDLTVRDGQLYAQLELTSEGSAAVSGKVYKFFSTEYSASDLEDLGDGRVRPLRLSGLALTNRPNNRGGKPISNRADQPSGGQTQDEIPTKSMKTIAEKLGLPADADEATIVNAITALITKVEGLEKATKEAEADAVMNRMGERIPKDARPHWREQLIANRATTEKLLEASFPAQGADARIHNRGAATPAPVEKTDGQQSASKSDLQEAAVRDIMNRSNCGYEAAFDQAMREKPELFR